MSRKKREDVDVNQESADVATVATDAPASDPVANGAPAETPKQRRSSEQGNRPTYSIFGHDRANDVWELITTEETIGKARKFTNRLPQIFYRLYDRFRVQRTKTIYEGSAAELREFNSR